MIVLINSHSFGFNISIASNTDNYNLRNDLINNRGWNGTDVINVNVTVESAVLIKATATSTPAFVANLSAGSTLKIINKGTIRGEGGAGGAGGSYPHNGNQGGIGGDAISLQNVATTIDNGSGTISGGGCGGGGTGGTQSCETDDPEDGCAGCVNRTGAQGGKGAGGTTSSPTSNGGALGVNGSAGSQGSNFAHPHCRAFSNGGGGGSAGKAVSLLSGGSRTITSNGTIHGATS